MNEIELEIIRDTLLYLWLAVDKDSSYYEIIESKIRALTDIIKTNKTKR